VVQGAYGKKFQSRWEQDKDSHSILYNHPKRTVKTVMEQVISFTIKKTKFQNATFPGEPEESCCFLEESMADKNKRKMQDTSLDTFDEILNDGSLGERHAMVLQLIEDNPGLTVMELVKEVPEWGNDRNKVAPRCTELADEGIIIRPRKRKCSVRGRRVQTHELAPKAWRQHRAQLYRTEESRKFVKNRMEIESSKNPDIIHTVIEWTDGSVSCTCHELYHRSKHLRCHHALGMIQALTGKSPKEVELEKKLKNAKEIIEELIDYVGNPALSAVQEAEIFLEDS